MSLSAGNIYDSLPDAARQLYHEADQSKDFKDWTYQLSSSQRLWLNLNLLRLYPLLCNMKYLNSNEFLCVVVNGEHRIYQGPGFKW